MSPAPRGTGLVAFVGTSLLNLCLLAMTAMVLPRRSRNYPGSLIARLSKLKVIFSFPDPPIRIGWLSATDLAFAFQPSNFKSFFWV